MRHTKTPGDNGYYWVKDAKDGEWFMAHLDAEADEPTLTYYSQHYRDVAMQYVEISTNRWRNEDTGLTFQAAIWHGPLNCPGGDFGGPILEADEEAHEQAEKLHRAIRITHVDFSHCDDEGTGGTVTSTGLVSRAEAWEALGKKSEAKGGT